MLLKEQGSSNLVQNIGHKGPVLRPRCIGPGRAQTQIPFNSNSTVGYCYLHVRLNIPIEISCSFWWGIWEKLVRAKTAPIPEWL